MKIIVIGAGDVGTYLSKTFSEKDHDVTVIEMREAIAREVDENLNVRVIEDNGASANTLLQAGVADADFFLAMTSDDHTNLIACSIGKALGAKYTIARVHDQTYADNSLVNYQLHFGIDHLINPEALSAVQLAKFIRNPGRVAVENFARGQIEVRQVIVSERSKLIDRSLRDIKLPAGTRIGLIHENDGQLLVPGGNTVIQAGQILTLVGSPENISQMKEKIEPQTHSELTRIVLFGASETTIALIRLLKSPHFKIRVIESDPRRCYRLAERFPQVTVIQGSATSLRLMEEEQIGSADYFIASTKDDEENIMTCLLAKQLGTAHVLLVLNKTDYEDILDQMKETLGVEMAVAPRQQTVAEVMRYVATEPVIELANFSDGMELIEVRVSPDCPVIGKEIQEIHFPMGALIVAQQHKFSSKVPNGSDRILADDRLVIITSTDKRKEVVRLLA